MARYLRKVIYPQAHENYRAILKHEDGEFEIGSIGVQHDGAWSWGIDTVIPMRASETQGEGKDRKDCMRQFKVAWERFAGYAASQIPLQPGITLPTFNLASVLQK